MHLSEPVLLESFGTPVVTPVLCQTAAMHYISRAGFSAASCVCMTSKMLWCFTPAEDIDLWSLGGGVFCLVWDVFLLGWGFLVFLVGVL